MAIRADKVWAMGNYLLLAIERIQERDRKEEDHINSISMVLFHKTI